MQKQRVLGPGSVAERCSNVTAMMLGSEVVVALGEPGAADAGRADPSIALATELAAALDVPLRTLHVEAEPDDVAPAIAEGLLPTSILVIHSEQANRWSGKWSVAEHVIDQWGGIAVAVGPRYSPTSRPGPVLTAVDGSPSSLRVVEPARAVANTLHRSIQFCQVVPTTETNAPDRIGDLPVEDTTFVVGNDPISALLGQADSEDSAMIVLAARGDRASARPSISRTCAGVIAGAAQPVVIVGTQWQPTEQSVE